MPDFRQRCRRSTREVIPVVLFASCPMFLQWGSSTVFSARAKPMAIIQASDLTKTYRVVQKKEGVLGAPYAGLYRREYREVRAVDQISFTIEPGEMVAFLGPNGAGKTTTLKMLSGLIYPTSGEAQGAGLRPLAAGRRLPPPVRAGDGPEEPALVGPAGRRQLRAPSRDLLDPAGRVPPDAGRADRAPGCRRS